MKNCNFFACIVFLATISSFQIKTLDTCQSYQKKFDSLIGNDLDSAIVIAYQHKEFAIRSKSDSSYLKSSRNLLSAYIYKGEKDSIFHYYRKIEEHPNIIEHSLLRQKAVIVISAYYINSFKSDSAIALLTPLLEEPNLNPNIYVKGCLNIGTAYANNYDNATCLEYLKKADSVALKNELTAVNQADLYSSFGLTFHNTAKFDDAIQYNEKSINIRKTNKEFTLIPYLYNNTALAAIELLDYKKAKSAIDSAFHYLPHLPNYEGAIYWSLGSYYQGKEQNIEAKNAFQKVIDFYKDVPNDFYKHNAIISLVFAKSKLGETKGFEPYLSLISPEMKKSMSIRDSLFLFNASLVEQIGKSNSNLAKEMNKSILLSNRYLTEVQESAIADQLEKYQTEKKEQEIVLLNKQNELEQAKANRNLLFLLASLLLGSIITFIFFREKKHNQTLTQKNDQISLLNKDIEHRTANHLQTMMVLIESDIDNSQDSVIQSALLGQQHRLQVVSSIHAQLQHERGSKNILLGKYLIDLCNYLEDFYLEKYENLNINLNIETKEGYEIDALDATTMGLIINELVTNAIKYAFEKQEHPRINIELKETDEHLALAIKDNGIGIVQDKTREGAKGIDLVKDLVERLQGTYDMKNVDGLLCSISFRPKTIAYAPN